MPISYEEYRRRAEKEHEALKAAALAAGRTQEEINAADAYGREEGIPMCFICLDTAENGYCACSMYPDLSDAEIVEMLRKEEK